MTETEKPPTQQLHQDELFQNQQNFPITISITAARVTFWAAGLFLVLLAVLHILKPDYDPSWRMMSEYAIGRFGWVMQLAFFSLSIASLSATAAVWPQVKSIVGYIGLVFLLIAAISATIGGIFPSDPITTSPDALSANGKVHILGAQLGIPAMPLAVAFLSWALTRHNQAWASARRWLWLTVGFVWLNLVAIIFLLFVVAKGTPGPDVFIGWPNRLFITGYSLWLMIVAWQIIKQYKLIIENSR
jgi:hypothetical protein